MPIRHIPIDSLEEGYYCDSVYLVRKRVMATAKTGKPYLNIVLADKTGEITARVFNNVEMFAHAFSEGDFIYVQARVQVYEGRMQMIIDSLERIPVSEINSEDFLPSGRHDPAMLLGHLRAILDTVEDEKMRALCVMAVFEAPHEKKWRRAPAAQNMHHSFLGGLLEHTLSVLMLLDVVGRHYRNVDRDMLLAGGLFHDIGKLWELDYETSIGYSDQGRLVPHLIIGVQLIDRLTAKIEKFPEEKKLLLQHIVLAHHGSREFGSPVLPATAEAVIIHYIDDMDAKVWSYQTQVEKAPPDALWSDRHNLLGTAVRRTSTVKKAIYDYRLPGESAEAPAAETGPAFPVKEPQRKSAKAAEAGQIDLLKK